MPDVRRLESAWYLSLTGGFVSTVAMFVYSYRAGGASLAAVYGLVRTLPGALITPMIMSLADRIPRGRLLRRVTGARAVLVGLVAVAVATQLSSVLAISLAGASASLSAMFRPVQAAALPWLARTPAELTAANIVSTVGESLAALSGPALAGVVLVVWGSAGTLAVAAGFLGLAVLALRWLHVPDEPGPKRDRALRMVAREGATGIAALGRVAPPAGLAVLAFAQTFVRGALLVLVVLLAVEDLAMGEGAVGWLNAALGVGGILGGVVAATVIRLTRLGRCFVLGVALWGLPLVVLAAVPSPVVAYAALVVVGVGNVIQDGAGFTLLPRVLGIRVAGRALGALEPVALCGVGAGSIAAPLLVNWLGLRATLAVLGAALLLLAAAHLSRFARIDRTLPGPPPEIGLLRQLPMFAALPVVTVEQLAADLERQTFASGDTVVREGQPGERFYLIIDGHALVSVGGNLVPRLGPGDGFGEIALLRDVPRTASVVADGLLHTVALSREQFLSAVLGNRISTSYAESLAQQRLARAGM